MPLPTSRLALTALIASLALAACSTDTPAPEAEEGPPVASAAALADSMLARYEANLGQAPGFTVIGGGFAVTHAPLSPGLVDPAMPQVAPVDSVAEADRRPDAIALLMQHLPNVRRIAGGLREAALSGPIERDGARVYRLIAQNPGALLGLPDASAEDDRQSLEVYVDARTFDVREIYQGLRVDSLARPITSRLLYDDFRDVDGLRLPFRIRQVQEGADQLYPEDLKMVQGGQLELQRRQVEQQPASPERDRQLAEVTRQIRSLVEGIDETELRIDAVRLRPAAPSIPAAP